MADRHTASVPAETGTAGQHSLAEARCAYLVVEGKSGSRPNKRTVGILAVAAVDQVSAASLAEQGAIEMGRLVP